MDLHFASATDALPRAESLEPVWVPPPLVLELADGDDELIGDLVAAFTTDIPALTRWGKPLLIGPGSIHVAHTDSEYIEKKQLLEAIDLYAWIARELLGRG